MQIEYETKCKIMNKSKLQGGPMLLAAKVQNNGKLLCANIKKYIFLVAFVVFAFSSKAQGFDWVRSYYGPDNSDGTPVNEILGSVMDSEGNVYILGQFIGGAHWDGGTDETSGILPFSAQRNRSTLIAKYSPNGDLVWHKELYSSYSDMDSWTIRMKGDSAIMVYTGIYYPFDEGYSSTNVVYYFDTLLTTADRFPQYPDSLDVNHYGTNALITLDLKDGSIIDELFFMDAYVKPDGSLLKDNVTNNLVTRDSPMSFNIDSEGNIILLRRTYDLYASYCDTCPDGIYIWSPTEGNLVSRRMLINGGEKHLDIPLERSSVWNWQLIKLTPNFDSVIASAYIFDKTWEYDLNEMISVYLHSFEIDSKDNMYICLERSQLPRMDTLPIKYSQSLAMEWTHCMLRYSPEFIPTGIVQNPTMYIPSGHTMGGLVWLNTTVDTATNSLFLMGFADTDYDSLKYNGTHLDLNRNACWMRLDVDDLSFISYGKARADDYCNWKRTYMLVDKWRRAHNGSFAVKNNRVFCQVKFQSNMLFQDTMINRGYGMGLFVWDYDGHEIAFIDYNSEGMYDEQGYIHLKDSSVWVSGTLCSAADLGGFHVNYYGNSTAYIARYSDTAFMNPYVYDSTGHGGGDVHITVVGDEEAFVAYPNPFRQRVTIRVENGDLKIEDGVATAWLTDVLGRREQVYLAAEAPGRYTLDLTARPQATYLLTITTNTGKTHTIRLMKMSDIFSR